MREGGKGRERHGSGKGRERHGSGKGSVLQCSPQTFL